MGDGKSAEDMFKDMSPIQKKLFLKKADKILKNMSPFERGIQKKLILIKKREFIKKNRLSPGEMDYFNNNYLNLQKNQFVEVLRIKINKNRFQENFNLFEEVIKVIKELNEEYNDYIKDLDSKESK